MGHRDWLSTVTAVGVVVALGCAVPAAAAPIDPASESVSGNEPAGDTGSSAWAVPDESVAEDADLVAKRVGRHESVRVVALLDRDGKPEFSVRRATGKDEAVSVVEQAQDMPDLVSVAVDTPVRAAELSNDRYRPNQWAMSMLKAETAWKSATGAGVVVAVIDTGVDATHDDLQGALVAGKNTRGDRGDTSSPTVDAMGHGTHVAGTIAARANNGIGVAGVAPGSRIMPIKALDSAGTGFISDVAEGMVWAVDHGARVLNLSLGGSPNSVLQTAIEYAVGRGTTVVAAAGNGGSSDASYPAAYPGVLSVMAISSSSLRASFSNYGSSIDLAAPGVSVLSTAPGDKYASSSGTSMATPHVSGAAALVRSANPHVDVAGVLTATTDDLGGGGKDAYFGYGRVNLVAALAAARAAPTVKPATVRTAQHLSFTGRVSRGHRLRLPGRSREGVPVRKWRTRTKNLCQVVRSGPKWRVKGLRKGRCVLSAEIPATGNHFAGKGRGLVWVR